MRLNKFLALSCGVAFIALTLIPQTYGRRIHAPHNYNSLFLDKILACLDYTAEDVADSDFFTRNWDLLNDGIKIVFNSGSFLEVRTTQDIDIILVQLFGVLSPEERKQLEAIFNNLGKECKEKNFLTIFLNLSKKKLDGIEIDVAYSILSLSGDSFDLVVEDVVNEGEGDGAKALPDDVVDTINEMGDFLKHFIGSGLLELSLIPPDKNVFIDKLSQAIEKTDWIIEHDLGLDANSSKEELDYYEDVIESFQDIKEMPADEGGDILYRIIYRKSLEQYYRFPSNASDYSIKELARQGFMQVTPQELRRGILLDIGPGSFVEVRLNDEIGIMNIILTDHAGEQPYLAELTSQFNELCRSRNVIPHLLNTERVLPIEPAQEAFGIIHLSQQEFSILIEHLKVEKTSSGHFGVDSGMIDFITSMYEDIIRHEARRLNFTLDKILMDKEKLVMMIMSLIENYDLLLARSKPGSKFTFSGENVSYEEIEEKINRYKEYASALNSEFGNVIYRIFYCDFLRTDPWVAREMQKPQ